MYVFAYLTKTPSLYPPHGIRVGAYSTIDELIGDVVDLIDCIDENANPQIWSLKDLEHELDINLPGSWSLYSDEDGYLPQWDQRGFVFDILGPDDVSISPGYFRTRADVQAALANYVERFREQGYYSTAGGMRIPLNQIEAHCRIRWIEIEVEDVSSEAAAAELGGAEQPAGVH